MLARRIAIVCSAAAARAARAPAPARGSGSGAAAGAGGALGGAGAAVVSSAVLEAPAMALAIDTEPLGQHCTPLVQRDLDKLVGSTERRFQVVRLSAHATVIHDETSSGRPLTEVRGELSVAKQEALDWQGDQDEDLDEPSVFHHLQHQATSSPFFEAVISQKEFAITTVVASCAPALGVRAQSPPLSSFHRYSLRSSFLTSYNTLGPHRAGNGDPNILPDYSVKYADWEDSASFLRIVGAGGNETCVVWHLQCDIVDLRNPKAKHGLIMQRKRRRTSVNCFMELASATVGAADTREENQFYGVRYRPNRRKWIAEMKPPKSKNKVSFGDFKTAAQAARVVDAAFHHYNKPDCLNFADSPGILSKRPAPPAALNEDDKLKFVKGEAKWLASIAPTLSSSLSLGSSSVQISEGWTGADDSSPVRSNSPSPGSQAWFQSTWMNSVVMSPPVPTIPVPPSPRCFQEEVVRDLLEQQWLR